jgi:hypothetical protein
VARWLARPTPGSHAAEANKDDEADAPAAPPVPDADWFTQRGIAPPQPYSTTPSDNLCATPPDIWPSNALTVRVFCAMQTQWQVGMGGPVGLLYASLPRVEQALAVPPAQATDVFWGLQVMERATLKVWAAAQAARK